MQTLKKANTILGDKPQEVAHDALGLSVLVLVLFIGFLLPSLM